MVKPVYPKGSKFISRGQSLLIIGGQHELHCFAVDTGEIMWTQPLQIAYELVTTDDDDRYLFIRTFDKFIVLESVTGTQVHLFPFFGYGHVSKNRTMGWGQRQKLF